MTRHRMAMRGKCSSFERRLSDRGGEARRRRSASVSCFPNGKYIVVILSLASQCEGQFFLTTGQNKKFLEGKHNKEGAFSKQLCSTPCSVAISLAFEEDFPEVAHVCSRAPRKWDWLEVAPPPPPRHPPSPECPVKE